MSLIFENPWPLIWVCLGLAAMLVVAMRMTQQGKFLLWAAVVAALAGLLLVADAVVVTDAERVEMVVDALVDGVRKSDPDAVLALLSDSISIEDIGGQQIASGPTARLFVRLGLEAVRFDILQSGSRRVEVGAISRQAKVDLRIFVAGRFAGSQLGAGFGTKPGEGSDWSIGLDEIEKGVWKIERITPISLPGDARLAGLVPRVGR